MVVGVVFCGYGVVVGYGGVGWTYKRIVGVRVIEGYGAGECECEVMC